MPAAAAQAAAEVGGSILQTNAANKASKAAQTAQQANLAFTKGVYNDAQTNLQPTISGGIRSGNALQGLLGVGGDPAAAQRAWDQYRNSTNYNFLFDQGQRATETSNAAALHSGATDKALINYGQGMAGNALAGYEGLLQGQQQLGANSAVGLASAGLGAGSQVANANNMAAQTAGSAGLYGANAQQNALSGLSSLINKNATASSFTSPNNPGGYGGGYAGNNAALDALAGG